MHLKPKSRMVIVDDELDFYKALQVHLNNYFVFDLVKSFDLKDRAIYQKADMVLFDLNYGTPYGYREGVRQLPALMQLVGHHTPVVIVSDDKDPKTYMDTIEQGVSHYLIKESLDCEEWSELLLDIKSVHRPYQNTEQFVNRSLHLSTWIRRAPLIDKYYTLPVLITGETGSGKTAFIKQFSALYDPTPDIRQLNHPFLLNELFENGAKGSYVNNDRSQGSEILLFNGIDKADMVRQHDILKFVKRLMDKSAKTNCKCVFTSTIDLRQAASSGYFLQELYDVISVIEIDIPPLRERRSDIEPLIETFLSQPNCCPPSSPFFRKTPNIAFDKQCLKILKQEFWEGNVRELRTTIQRAVRGAFLRNKSQISQDCLPERFSQSPMPTPSQLSPRLVQKTASFEADRRLEEIEDVLNKTGANQSRLKEQYGEDYIELKREVTALYKKFPFLFSNRVACRRTFQLADGFYHTIHMTIIGHKKRKIFISEFQKHLSSLEQQYPITVLDNLNILPGHVVDEYLQNRVAQTHLYLICVCPDFIADDSLRYGLLESIDRRLKEEPEKTSAIPIIVRPCNWKSLHEIASLQSLPRNMNHFPSDEGRRDEAFCRVINDLEVLIKKKFRRKS